MPIPTLPLRGQCRCGITTIQVTAAPIMTAACHCTGCQRMSGSAFSLTAMIPTAGFAVTRGEPVLGGARSDGLEHMFCPECMTWMFTRPSGADFVNLRPTMLDDHSWFTPFIETMTEAKLPWVSLPVAHSFPAFPAMEDFGPLMQQFAAAQT